MNCEFCQSPVHVWFQCPKKPDGWKPARLAKQFQGSLTEEHRLRERSNVTTKDNSPSLASDVGQSEGMGPVVRKMGVAPQGSTPAPGAKSTAARKDVQNTISPESAGPERAQRSVRLSLPVAGTQALPVDAIRKPGRPKTGFNKTLYNREYMRKRRAANRASS